MTPKEKAQELKEIVQKYSTEFRFHICHIIVDEIIKQKPSLPVECFGGMNPEQNIKLSTEWWKKVKLELYKLE